MYYCLWDRIKCYRCYKTATSLEFNYKGLNVAVECEYSNAAYANWLGNRLVEDYRVGNVKGILRVSYNFNHVWNL